MKNKAFTLIELSIVLVIIGLIIGGVLVGRDLIKAAEIRAQVKQIQNYELAYNAFKLKYNCVPGDCRSATTFFGTTDQFGNALGNGNGNGSIDTGSGQCFDNGAGCGNDTWSASPELYGVFQQLSAAQMIDFKPLMPNSHLIGTGYPAISINPTTGFFIGASYNFSVCCGDIYRHPAMTSYKRGTNDMWLLTCNVTSSIMGNWDNSCGVFFPSDLRNIDLKIDDGVPLKGRLMGFGGALANYDCLIAGNTDYDVSQTTRQCQAVFLLD